MAKIKVQHDEVIQAIKDAGGKVTGICELLGITRATFYRYAKNKDVVEAVEFAQVRIVDRAEHKLAEAVERGEGWAIQLVLKDSKRGKERGYGNSVDVTSGGKSITWMERAKENDIDPNEVKRIADEIASKLDNGSGNGRGDSAEK